MNAKRATAAPPDLPGFTYVDVLGSGGFADVFLYEQQLPKRRVAVKVLLTDRMSSGSVAEFTAEANVMAMLSTHPAIVTIYQAGVARDGRPYLVMEYCPKPNLQARYRREPFSVAESLRVGVQVAAAVETAHRAGVLHRDIKPANILVTEYNRPALTDFGIASTTTAAAESAGLSIPWSPPESFADVPQSDPRSDVYALGATVYTLLAGRSPFELPGQRNGAADLIQRIETAPLPPLGRADTPVSLQRTLERAMAKNPADRYESALAFARALQKVQIELAHSVTPIDILDDSVPDDIEEDEDEGHTRVRGVVSIDPHTVPAAGPTRPAPSVFAPSGPPAPTHPAPTYPAAGETVRRDAVVADTVRPAPAAVPASAPAFAAPHAIEHTISRASVERPAGADAASAASAPVAPDAPRRSRAALWWSLSAVAAVAIVAGIIAVAIPALNSAPTPQATGDTVDTAEPMDPISSLVAKPTDVTGAVAADGSVVFTWKNPDPKDGDRYLWAVQRPGEDPVYEAVDQPTVTVPSDPSGRTCISVAVVRVDSNASSDEAEGCTP